MIVLTGVGLNEQMSVSVGDVVEIHVTFDGNYAVWGQTNDRAVRRVKP